MDVYEAFLTHRRPKHYEWTDFIGAYESICHDIFLAELNKFPFLQESFSEVILDSLERVSNELGELADYHRYTGYEGPELRNKADLVNFIIKVTDLCFKRELLNYLPAQLKAEIHYLWEIGNIRFGILEELISERADLQIETEKYPWFNDDEEPDTFFNEHPDVEDVITFFDSYSVGETAIYDQINQWNHLLVVNPIHKIVQLQPIKIVEHFDFAIYELIKKQPQLLKTMDWRLFEEMLADLLKHFGYDIELTRPTKDGGIDIIALKRNTDFGQHKYILQAKRYKNAVEVSPVRELLFLKDHHQATKCCLATTATFTKGAWELAQQYKWQLELKDQMGIMSWIDQILKMRKP